MTTYNVITYDRDENGTRIEESAKIRLQNVSLEAAEEYVVECFYDEERLYWIVEADRA